MRDYISFESKVRFLFPIDGEVINCYDITKIQGKECIKVKLVSDSPVKVNGVELEKVGNIYTGYVPFSGNSSVFNAESQSGERDRVKVFCFENSVGYYRLSSDDNIYFLYNINKNKDVYKSIFEDPYLAVYKKAHELYGACVHLNVYYRMPKKHPDFSLEREEFDLSMMTDKFKAEWEENSHWLKLNFHAKQDLPPKPYENTDYDTIYKDCLAVQQEIRRFAGEKTLSNETTLHFGASTYEGVRALRALDIKTLGAYFVLHGGKPLVSYFYPKYLVEHLGQRDFWVDSELDMRYCKIDRVLNLHSPEDSVRLLEETLSRETTAGFIELMIHEEYFYNDYVKFMPDFEARILEPCKWAWEKGYKGIFLDDVR